MPPRIPLSRTVFLRLRPAHQLFFSRLWYVYPMSAIGSRSQILYPLFVVLALGLAAFIGVTSIHAQIASEQTSPLVQMLAAKFGLKTADVQAVFDQYHQNQVAAREAKYQSFLDQAVAAGQITSAQEQLILQKHQQLQNQWQTSGQNHKQQQLDLQSWAAQNGIPLQYLFGGINRGPRGFHRPFSTPTPTP